MRARKYIKIMHEYNAQMLEVSSDSVVAREYASNLLHAVLAGIDQPPPDEGLSTDHFTEKRPKGEQVSAIKVMIQVILLIAVQRDREVRCSLGISLRSPNHCTNP